MAKRSLKSVCLLTTCAAALGLMGLKSGPALAQEAQTAANTAPIVLSPLSVTATRSETAPEDVPAVVSVITADEIDDNLVTDIKDLVQFEPGVAVRTNPARFTAALGATGRDGNSGFNIRGLEGNRVLMVLDGVRLPDGFSFGAQAVGRGDYVDVGLLRSIEIVRGPASALYGSDGLAGVVSYTTKDPEDYLRGDRTHYFQLRTGYDTSDNTWSKSALGAVDWGNWSVLGTFERRDGHAQETKGTNISANTDRTVAIPQDVKSNAGLAKVVFAPDVENIFRFTYDHLDSDTDSNVLSAIAKPPLTATSTLGLIAEDTTRRNRLTLDHRFNGEFGFINEAFWAVYYQESASAQFAAEDRNTSADRTRYNTFKNRVIGLTLQLGSIAETGALTHHFIYGGDISVTRQSGIRSGTVPPAGETYPTRAFPTSNYTLGGVYVQDEIKAFDERLILYPSLRLDFYDLSPKADTLLPGFTPTPQSGNHLSPKIGTVYKLTEEVRVFANYARGFKAPTPSQVNNFFANPVQFYSSLPNPNLKPETSEGIDGGLRLNTTWVAAELSGFVSWYRNFIDQIQVSGAFTPTNPGIFQYQNVGKAKISGIEGKTQFDVGSGITLKSALSYAKGDTTIGTTTSPLNTVEPFKLVGGVGYRAPSNTFGGSFVATYSAGKSASRVQQTCTPSCYTPPGFVVLDLTAYWNIAEWATLRGGLFNITDKKYWWWSDVRGVASNSTVLDAYTQPGRNVRASLTVKF